MTTKEPSPHNEFELLRQVAVMLELPYNTPAIEMVEKFREIINNEDRLGYRHAWAEVADIIGCEYDEAEYWAERETAKTLQDIWREYIRAFNSLESIDSFVSLKAMVEQTFGSIENFEKNREQIATVLQEQTNNA